jgi:hypothetical protein
MLQDGATVVVALEKAGPLGIRFRDEVRDREFFPLLGAPLHATEICAGLARRGHRERIARLAGGRARDKRTSRWTAATHRGYGGWLQLCGPLPVSSVPPYIALLSQSTTQFPDQLIEENRQVRTLSYADAIGLLRDASRPVTLRFKVGVSTGFRAPVAAYPVPVRPRHAPDWVRRV